MGRLSEAQVVEIWQRLVHQDREFVTESGQKIRIAYPGRPNDARGGDFRDAVIESGGSQESGNIEVHVKSSDWQAHRHHLDPSYADVILHVVMWNDIRNPGYPQGAGRMLALENCINSPSLPFSPDPEGGMPCAGAGERERTGPALDEAGEERFRSKSARFEEELSHTEAGEVLYRGIMGALGYSRNSRPCLELARRLPLHTLELAAAGVTPAKRRLDYLQEVILGTAGLLTPPGGRPGKPCAVPGLSPMSPRDWDLFRVRPNNHPARRLKAMGCLVSRFPGGLLAGITEMVKAAPADRPQRLCRGIEVRTGMGQSAPAGTNGSLMGAGRASEIAVNIVLPFAAAWGKKGRDPELAEKALCLYRCFPRLPSNAIIRHMQDQSGADRRLVNSARRQQGLLHIYHAFCRQARCRECRLG